MSPLELARYDIVVVSYETLCKEFYYAVSHEMSKSLRKRKRYYYSPSPLPALLWWRVSRKDVHSCTVCEILCTVMLHVHSIITN